MKVTSTMSPAVARDHVKPAAARSVSSASDDGTTVGKANEKTAAAANSAKHVPPGLERVQARLEGIPAESRNAGQTRALENIGLNIARYRERHGLASDAPATPDTPPPEATVPSTPPDATAPATTPEDPAPVATVPTEPAAPAAEAPSTDPAPSAEAPATAPVALPATGEASTSVVDTPADTPATVADTAAGVVDAPATVADAPATITDAPTIVADATATAPVDTPTAADDVAATTTPTAAPIDIAALIPPSPLDPAALLPAAGSVINVEA